MKAKIVLLAIALGEAVEAYTIGDDWNRVDIYANSGRLIGGTLGWAVVIGIVLFLIASIYRRFFHARR